MLFNRTIKVGELIRSRVTRHVYLIVNKTNDAIFIVDLMSQNNNPAPVSVILPGQTDRWDKDTDIDDLEEWEAQILQKKLPMLHEAEYHEPTIL